MKKMMGFGVLFLLAVLMGFAVVVSVDWEPTPATCEPHGLRQMPC